MPTRALPAHRITSPASLAASLPALVGFTPVESLVVVFVKDDLVVVTMRLDLADVSHGINDYTVSTAQHVKADSVLIATYTSEPGNPVSHRGLITGLRAALEDANVQMLDALSIVDNRYWSYLCEGASCCPTAGSPISPTPVRSRSVTASATATLPTTREDVAGRYVAKPEQAPSPELISEAMLNADPDVLTRAQQAWEVAKRLGTDPSLHDLDGADDRLCAQLLVWVQNVHVRDFILCTLAGLESDAEKIVDALVDMALRSPVELRPRAAGMAAAALAAFDPSTFPVACLVNLADGDSLAQLVGASITQAVPPTTIRDLFAEGLAQVLQVIKDNQQQ